MYALWRLPAEHCPPFGRTAGRKGWIVPAALRRTKHRTAVTKPCAGGAGRRAPPRYRREGRPRTRGRPALSHIAEDVARRAPAGAGTTDRLPQPAESGRSLLSAMCEACFSGTLWQGQDCGLPPAFTCPPLRCPRLFSPLPNLLTDGPFGQSRPTRPGRPGPTHVWEARAGGSRKHRATDFFGCRVIQRAPGIPACGPL